MAGMDIHPLASYFVFGTLLWRFGSLARPYHRVCHLQNLTDLIFPAFFEYRPAKFVWLILVLWLLMLICHPIGRPIIQPLWHRVRTCSKLRFFRNCYKPKKLALLSQQVK